ERERAHRPRVRALAFEIGREGASVIGCPGSAIPAVNDGATRARGEVLVVDRRREDGTNERTLDPNDTLAERPISRRGFLTRAGLVGAAGLTAPLLSRLPASAVRRLAASSDF